MVFMVLGPHGDDSDRQRDVCQGGDCADSHADDKHGEDHHDEVQVGSAAISFAGECGALGAAEEMIVDVKGHRL
jgi:hypothetical protein